MLRSSSRVFLISAVLLFAACSQRGLNSLPAGPPAPSKEQTQTAANRRVSYKHVCGAVVAHHVRCFSLLRTGVSKTPFASSPIGYGPSDLQSAYGLVTAAKSKGAGQTVAIVDAYDDPNAESDLNVYRSTFGLSPCTTHNKCFRKLDQNGRKIRQNDNPPPNSSWAVEISLDLDMVSAICPNCHILLIEAKNNIDANLFSAVDEAAALGANEISNSYGESEYTGELPDQSHYNHPGIAVTVASGDGGYGVDFPAASQYVTAVGGTTLNKTGAETFSETVWNYTSSGCSGYIPQPSWQTALGSAYTSQCGKRIVGDVAADADPATGVSVYDTYNQGGWLLVGGTSAASPIIASVYALAGNASTVTAGSYSYSHTSSLNDVTTGSDGYCGAFLCMGETGYDGPTGNGTPNGTGAF